MNRRIGTTECFERSVDRMRNVTNVIGHIVGPPELLPFMAADYRDLVPAIKQLWNKVTAHEACPSSNKHVHHGSGRATVVGTIQNRERCDLDSLEVSVGGAGENDLV